MKKSITYIFLLISFFGFSQKKILKKVQTNADEVVIYTAGLDDLILENSTSNNVEVVLFADSYDDQLIKINENKSELNINFYFEGTETREVIFRKFITKRLQRANAVIQVPRNKKVTIYGENVDIESKNIENQLEIYIDNGIIKLNSPQKNTTVKLYAGNVYLYDTSSSIDIISNLGSININEILYNKTYQKKVKKSNNSVYIQSIKANIFLTTN